MRAVVSGIGQNDWDLLNRASGKRGIHQEYSLSRASRTGSRALAGVSRITRILLRVGRRKIQNNLAHNCDALFIIHLCNIIRSGYY